MTRALVLAAILAGCAARPAPRAPTPPPLAADAYAHYLAGKLAAARENWPAAATALAAAAQAAPDQAMIAVELARAQHKAQPAAPAARDTLARARVRWPRHAQVWLASGEVLARSARAEAVQMYRRAIALEPRDERAYLGLARLEAPAAALATLRQLIRVVPDSVDGHYRLGQRLAVLRDLPGATAEMRAVLERDPDHIDARLDLARLLRWQGALPEAIAQTRGAFDRSGQALDIAEELFWVLCEADDLTGALDLLSLLDDARSDPDALAGVVRLHRGLGRLDDARTIAARLARVDSAAGALALAEIELAAGDPAAAAQRALAIDAASDQLVAARLVAATGFLAAGQPQRALDALAEIREAHPTHVELALAAALAQVDLGRAADAQRTLAPFGERAAAQLARARLAERAGDLPRALALAEAALRSEPDLVAALNLAGYLLADANQRLPAAGHYLARARELAPGDPAVLDSWGWLLHRRGAARDAVSVLERATRIAPREPEIAIHLALAQLAAGAPRATVAATLDRAAALQPPAPVARKLAAARAQLAGHR